MGGNYYAAVEIAGPGQVLTSEEPFPFRLEVASLLRRRTR